MSTQVCACVSVYVCEFLMTIYEPTHTRPIYNPHTPNRFFCLHYFLFWKNYSLWRSDTLMNLSDVTCRPHSNEPPELRILLSANLHAHLLVSKKIVLVVMGVCFRKRHRWPVCVAKPRLYARLFIPLKGGINPEINWCRVLSPIFTRRKRAFLVVAMILILSPI